MKKVIYHRKSPYVQREIRQNEINKIEKIEQQTYILITYIITYHKETTSISVAVVLFFCDESTANDFIASNIGLYPLNI